MWKDSIKKNRQRAIVEQKGMTTWITFTDTKWDIEDLEKLIRDIRSDK